MGTVQNSANSSTISACENKISTGKPGENSQATGTRRQRRVINLDMQQIEPQDRRGRGTGGKSKDGARGANATRPFVFWDGEAVQDGAGYCLLGSSAGGELCAPNLSTVDCLDFILQTGADNPRAFHVGFAFDYDVNNILKDVPWVKLIILKHNTVVEWEGYEIRHIPHKSFTVSREGTSVRIDDTFSFFRSSFLRALRKYHIGTNDEHRQISDGKTDRPDFQFADIDEKIRPYWQLELKLGTLLMDKIRRMLNDQGIFIGQWHGPGALAAYALRTNKMGQHKKPTPKELSLPTRQAYAGGWFERFKVGVHDGPIYSADINSAYAYGLAKCPSLSHGEWQHIQSPSPSLVHKTRLGLFRLRLRPEGQRAFSAFMATSHGVPSPLFHRSDHGMHHPTYTDGWYWGPEAALVERHPDVEFVEAWLFHDDGSRPFAWVEDMFLQRLALQAANDPGELPLKWILASLYGRSAQRAGWDKRKLLPPRWHQIEWAGYITSLCRSMVFEAAVSSARNGGLISIDTDGVLSTTPFGPLQNGIGNQLGRWKLEEYSGIIYVQNGIYWLRGMDGTWKAPKTRGIPSAQIADPEIAIRALRTDGRIHIDRHNFVGYGAAMRGRRDQWRTWRDTAGTIDANFSGNRQHIQRLCRACRAGLSMAESLHDLAILPVGGESKPHTLPWLEPADTKLHDELQRELHEIVEW